MPEKRPIARKSVRSTAAPSIFMTATSGRTATSGGTSCRMVVEAATDAVITIDENSTIMLVNPAVTKIFGYSSAEILGRPLTVLMPHDAAARHVRAIREYVRTDDRHINWDAVEAIAVGKTANSFPWRFRSPKSSPAVSARSPDLSAMSPSENKPRRCGPHTRDRSRCELTSVPRSLSRRHTSGHAAGMRRSRRQTPRRSVRAHLGGQGTGACSNFTPAPACTHLDGPHSRVRVGHLKDRADRRRGGCRISNDLTHDPRISHPHWAQATGMVGFAGYPCW